MNLKRTNPITYDHINITTYWLLGLIEGDGSFHLWRKNSIPVFSIVMSKQQLPVLIKIKELFINNLEFDIYSIFKIRNSSVIALNIQKPRNNSKSSVLLLIKNIRILYNYLIPFLNEVEFLSKKSKDFKDFKIICRTIYFGADLNNEIKSLLLKLSKTMNNFRLSTKINNNSKLLSPDEINTLINASPLVEHLWDGRVCVKSAKKIIHQRESSIYKILKPTKQVLITLTLSEAAKVIGVNIKTLSKYLDIKYPNNSEF